MYKKLKLKYKKSSEGQLRYGYRNIDAATSFFSLETHPLIHKPINHLTHELSIHPSSHPDQICLPRT